MQIIPKSQVGIISLGAFLVLCEARATRAHDPIDTRLLRSIASTAARHLTSSDMSESEYSRKSNSWNKPKGYSHCHWKIYQLCQLMIRMVQTEG